MQVSSFFEVYSILNKKTNEHFGSKIIEFSEMCDLKIADKNMTIDTNRVMMAGFKDIYIEKYIKKIQESGYTAVVYTQDESSKNTSRSLVGIFSPGTYFPNDSKNLTNNLTCIWIDVIKNTLLMKGNYVIVGVANIDIYTGKTSLFQFKEIYIHNPTTYDELERFISIHKPSEVIIISNLPNKELEEVIQFTNIQCNSIHKINLNNEDKKQSNFVFKAKNCEKQIYQTEVLSKFYKFDDYEIFIQNFYENNTATQAFCFLLDFVYQHNKHLVNKISEPIFENCSDRLILANHSLKQLNIIDDGIYTGKYSSVLKMLNECLTPMGKRKFDYHFLNPTTNIEYLQKEYNIIEYLLNNHSKYNSFLKNNLFEIKDLSKWERQIFLKKISPKSFFNMYNNILVIKNIYDFIIEDQIIQNYLKESNIDVLKIGSYCELILKFINENLDLNISSDIDQIQNFELNFIRHGVDKELDKKTDTLIESELKLEAIREYLSNLIENKEKKGKTTDYVKIHETEKNNYSLLCTSRRCKILQDTLPETKNTIILSYHLNDIKKDFAFIVSKTQFEFKSQTSSNNSIVDIQIMELCKNISNIKTSLKDLITNVYNKFVEKFERFQNNLECIIDFITKIDIIYTKSNISNKYNYCKPSIVEADKSFIDAKGLRHCLIEQLQNNEVYVTNDIILGNGKNDGLLLFGTNAVGKTSFIKALGISIIMAQAGLYVPCCQFIYKPYKYIFTRILGNDNIFKGLSTFAVEMSELRTILRLSDENSLILGDELCSGTENISAISIFVSGIKKLHECKSSFIFATHLHDIVDFEEIISLENVVMKHMEVTYDKEHDLLVYNRKIKDGSGSKTYGLEVCKSLNLPEDFLNYAHEIRMKYFPDSGSSILGLKQSHYNANKILSLCEKCGKNMGTEVHHLQHQCEANDDGIISNTDGSTFHKNKLANLMTLCESCHNEFHKSNKKNVRRVKTSKGYKVLDT